MSEYHDKYAPKGAKDRVDHIIGDNRKGKIDASDVKLPEREDMGERVIDKPRRAYKKGGKVEGETAHHHAGRKRRDAGGSTVDQLRPQVPSSGLYGSGFAPTHAGMLSNAAGLKKGGEARRHKRASGGTLIPSSTTPDYLIPNSTTGDYMSPDLSSMSSARVAAANRDKLKAAMTKDPDMNEELRQNNREYRDEENYVNNPNHNRKGGAVKKRACGGIANKVTGVRIAGGRTARAEGGRTKGKTNINIIIGGPKEAPPQQPMVPPPPSAMPPRPPLPPGAMGAMQPPGMGGGAPPMGGPGMPPQIPAGMGPK